eukprot:TRINITY_DN21726_c0_g1_i2.p2 TRINITY_DN21726_c0_g1~~TRINITY_DN21726_c0_g1_i2.p2  ORF type:complete len:180 (-),score=36.90 TRINITY_DN21726_c0_g1_i2:186-704(-)
MATSDPLVREAKRQRSDAEDGEEEDKWVDGLLRYRFRDGITLFSDPMGVLARGTGSSMWASGEVLCDYLAERPELCRDASCLELGSGLGAAGLTVGGDDRCREAASLAAAQPGHKQPRQRYCSCPRAGLDKRSAQARAGILEEKLDHDLRLGHRLRAAALRSAEADALGAVL